MANPKYIPCLLILILCSYFILYVHSQSSNSCNSPLNLAAPLPFDTSSLHCVVVWSAQSFVLRYVQASPNVWSFVLSAPNPNSYVAMGFSPDGQTVGLSAVVGWVGGDSALDTSDSRLQVSNLSMQLVQNQIYMAFQVTSDNPTSRLLYSVGPQGRLPASSNNALVQHQDRIFTSLNYPTGKKIRCLASC